MCRRTKILLTPVLILLAVVLVLTWQHSPPEREVTVFVIDSGFGPRFQPVLGRRSPAPMPGHGQLTRDIIADRVGRDVNIRELELAGSGEERRDNFYQHLRYIEDYASRYPQREILINISLAFPDYREREQLIMNRLKEASVLTVAAAGNSGDERDLFPAAYSGVLSVTGARSSGRYSYATYGDSVDLAASGQVSRFLPIRFSTFSLTRFHMEGTSFAAPRVAGDLARLAALSRDHSLAELVELGRNTAAPIEDELFLEGKLGSGLIQTRQIERMVAPEVYWRRWFIYAAVISIIISLPPVSSDLKYYWYRRKLAGVEQAEDLLDIAESGGEKIWEEVKDKLEDSWSFSRRKFARGLLQSEVEYEKIGEFWLEFSGDEIRGILLDMLKEEADPEKTAERLVRSSFEVSERFLESLNIQELFERDSEREMRFVLALLQEMDRPDAASGLARTLILHFEDPWLLYYALRALQESGCEEPGEDLRSALSRLKAGGHPLLQPEIELLEQNLEKDIPRWTDRR